MKLKKWSQSCWLLLFLIATTAHARATYQSYGTEFSVIEHFVGVPSYEPEVMHSRLKIDELEFHPVLRFPFLSFLSFFFFQVNFVSAPLSFFSTLLMYLAESLDLDLFSSLLAHCYEISLDTQSIRTVS